MAHEEEPQPHALGGEEAPPFWEWVMAGVGLLLLLASLGYLGWQAVQGPKTPPAPQVQALGVEPQGQRYLVRFRVHNGGDVTAEQLHVVGELRQQGQVVEQSETDFDFLPGGSSREGGLFFTRDPRGLQLDLQARSYRKP